MRTHRLTRLFVAGPVGEGELSVHDAGLLHLPTGRLVACDPYRQAAASVSPFTVAVPPGRYPVLVALLRRPGREQEVTAAMVRLADEPAVTWEMARQAGSEHRAFVSLTGAAAFLDAGADLVGLLGPLPAGLTTPDGRPVAFVTDFGVL